MKFLAVVVMGVVIRSHPARGAWIEIHNFFNLVTVISWSHPARGAWIEMLMTCAALIMALGRTPQGVRGLKCRAEGSTQIRVFVAPRKGCVD